MALAHTHMKMLSRKTRNTVRALAYRAGCTLVDSSTGESFSYADKDVSHVSLLLPKDAPMWAKNLQMLVQQDRQKGVQVFCNLAEGSEKRKDSQVYREWEFALPRELTDEQCVALAREYLQDQVCGQGMTVLANFHFDVDEETGERKPHCHAVILTRRLEENGLAVKKETDWNRRNLAQELRKGFIDYTNFHLAKHGYDARVDGRTYKEQGIDLIPQPKNGSNVQALRSRLGEVKRDVVTKVHEVGNLYRVTRNPETILKLLSSKQSTFTWGDVQQTLKAYVKDPAVCGVLEKALMKSSELVKLGEKPGALKAIGVFTTRAVVDQERGFLERLDRLKGASSHGLSSGEKAVGQLFLEERLKAFGKSPTTEQTQALEALTTSGRLSVLVGYAGSGKSTVLSSVKQAYEAAGYRVLGLAPTNRAKDNLAESMTALTVHKFLGEHDRGRYQLGAKTVLILDEAGMVDGKLFDRLTQVVEKQGVKLIAVGDGAQLQAVQGGKPFHQMLGIYSPKTLSQVVRQETKWQRDATQLFGDGNPTGALWHYANQGHVQGILQGWPKVQKQDKETTLSLYKTAKSLSGWFYHRMVVEKAEELGVSPSQVQGPQLKDHALFESYGQWAGRLEEARILLQAQGVSYGDAALAKVSGYDLNASTRQALVSAFVASLKHNPQDSHLMMAHTIQDVKRLNEGVRAQLKMEGMLDFKTAQTYTFLKETTDAFGRTIKQRTSQEVCVGDRLMMTRNNKGMGFHSGMMGSVVACSKNEIKLRLDRDSQEIVSIRPKLYPALEMAWAVNVQKAQGQTVDRSFVLASVYMTQNMSYVAMTRHKKDVQVFYNEDTFTDTEGLIQTLSRAADKTSSQDYLVKNLEVPDSALKRTWKRLNTELKSYQYVSQRVWSLVKGQENPESLYKTQKTLFEGDRATLLKVLEKTPETGTLFHEPEYLDFSASQEKALNPAVTPNREGVPQTPLTPSAPRQPTFVDRELILQSLGAKEMEAIFAEHIHHWVDHPKGIQRSHHHVRFGNKGGFVVNTKDGTWYSHYAGKGGDLFSYVAESTGMSYGESLKTLASRQGGAARVSRPEQAARLEAQRLDQERAQVQQRQEAQQRAQGLYAKSQPIQGTPAERYLKDTRGIQTASLPKDCRYLPATKTHPGSLISFARDGEGSATGYQRIFLTPEGKKNPDVEVTKRSGGVLKGSFVSVQEDKQGPLIVAEGLETALSLKEAGMKGTILCGFGQFAFHNIPLYAKDPQEVILVADFDGKDAPSTQALARAQESLKTQGYDAQTLWPAQEGEKCDFNDVLKAKGPEGVKALVQEQLGAEALKSPKETLSPAQIFAKKLAQPIHEKYKRSFEAFATLDPASAKALVETKALPVFKDATDSAAIQAVYKETRFLLIDYQKETKILKTLSPEKDVAAYCEHKEKEIALSLRLMETPSHRFTTFLAPQVDYTDLKTKAETAYKALTGLEHLQNKHHLKPSENTGALLTISLYQGLEQKRQTSSPTNPLIVQGTTQVLEKIERNPDLLNRIQQLGFERTAQQMQKEHEMRSQTHQNHQRSTFTMDM